jgi:hypothetical protein
MDTAPSGGETQRVRAKTNLIGTVILNLAGAEDSARPNRMAGAFGKRRPLALRQTDLFRLQAFRTSLHDERYAGTLIQCAITACLDSRKVDEDVLAIVALDESKSFSGVKPLHCTCFFHVTLSLLWSLSSD